MRIALVGNQNSGKTTLFNALTGMNQKIGNWPGVTVEKKEGVIKGTDHTLIDLPGIYSLSPYTTEEKIACEYLLSEKPDAIINIIDAVSLERSLYLTLQLLELDIPVIVALNMTDILIKKGGRIDAQKLSELLGVEVAMLSARRRVGVGELIAKVLEKPAKKTRFRYSERLEKLVSEVAAGLSGENARFVAVKLLENDPRFAGLATPAAEKILQGVKDEDFEERIASERYRYIDFVKKAVMITPDLKETFSDKIDRIILNKYLAFPIFVAVIFGLYFAVIMTGTALGDYMASLFDRAGNLAASALSSWGASDWAVSLIGDGVLGGIGAVLTFIPQIVMLFLLAALLESSGYLSRVSFLLDKIFTRLGLSGRALIPFIVGFGCSVPGIMATRTLENEQERKSAVILVPFIPCGAKLPIISLFAGFFFTKHRVLVSASLFFLSIFIIIIAALILKKVFKTPATAYISELPEYRLPDPRYVARYVCEKTMAFVSRAGSVILVGSVVIWFLLSFSPAFKYGVPVENSMLAGLGNLIAWFFYPIVGEWSWAAGVSALQGLVAKEQVVASLSIIAGFAGGASGADIFSTPVFAFFTPAAAYAFMAYNLFSAPCIGAIGAMRKELGGAAATIKAALFQTAIAWVVSALLYLILTFVGGLS
ncbi:MAG: ferrous iron transport protein B [Bacilli bacterium]